MGRQISPGRTAARSAGGSWTRIRLRAAPGAAAALAGMVLVTAFLAAALPRAMDAYQTSALRSVVARAPLSVRTVSLTETLTASQADESQTDPLTPAAVDAAGKGFERLVGPPLPLSSATARTAYGARAAQPIPAFGPGLPTLTPNVPSVAQLFAQQGLTSHARLTSGSWAPAAGPGGERVDAVVTSRTAEVMRLRPGSSVRISDATGGNLTVRVTGVVAPRDPADPLWRSEPSLLAPARLAVSDQQGNTKYYWEFGLIINRDSAHTLLSLPGGAELYWHRPIDSARLNPGQVQGMLTELASVGAGPALVRLERLTGQPDVEVDQQADTLLESYRTELSATEPVVLIAGIGAATVAAIVLLMAAGLIAGRRRAELSLLRSRGASLRGLAGRLLGETAIVALPAAALGTALSVVLVRSDVLTPSLLLGGAVAAVGALALPVLAAFDHRRPADTGRDREDLATARPSRRRAVLELTVLLLVAGAVVTLRRRGAADGGDPFVAAAPVLLAVATALVLIRLYPLPLRLLARPASRLSGAVAHLGLARAGRSPVATRLPLLALVVALSTASLGGCLLTEVTAGRERGALAEVGADARIDSETTLPGGLTARLREQVPGIRDVAPVRVEQGLRSTGQEIPYSLVEVDPASYARLSERSGVGAFPESALTGRTRDGVLPAVVSPGLRRQFGSGVFSVDAQAGLTRVRATAVAGATQAAPDTDFVIVSVAAVRRDHPGADGHPYASTSLYLDGSRLDGGRLRAAVAQDTTGTAVTMRSEVLAGVGTPLQSGVRWVYLAAVVAGAGYGAIALLLALLRTAPQRAATLARLRTMGMTRREFRRLALLEMAPQAVLAAAGGVLVALAAVAMLRPDVNLGVLAFGADRTGWPPGSVPVLHADPWSLAVPATGVLVVVYGVLAAQVWWAGRRRESTQLRVGDRV